MANEASTLETFDTVVAGEEADGTKRTLRLDDEGKLQVEDHLSKPAEHASAVTPSDSTTLETRALWVGTGGDVVATIGGDDVTFTNVPDGTLLPVVCTKVKAATSPPDVGHEVTITVEGTRA